MFNLTSDKISYRNLKITIMDDETLEKYLKYDAYLAKINYRAYFAKQRRIDSRDENGKVIGVHEGIVNFTIGQRKGIKISAKDPLYVIDINSEKNEIIVGPKKDLLKKEIILKDLNLLANKEIFNKEIFVKVRSTGKLLKSKLNIKKDKNILYLLEDEYGISPGQACAFYSKDSHGFKVLGGGWITK